MNPLELSGERFRHLAEDVVEMTAEYLSTLNQRRVLPRRVAQFSLTPGPEGAPFSRSLRGVSAQLRGVVSFKCPPSGFLFGLVIGYASV
jgi:hypothetical protein